MYTLVLCVGMFLGMCGSSSTYKFNTKEECVEARNHLEKSVGGGYAICVPANKDKQ